MKVLTGRQWASLVTGGLAASLAVIAGWSSGWGYTERAILVAAVGVLAASAQAFVFYAASRKRRNAVIPAMIPRPLAEFRGRTDDLHALKERFAEQTGNTSRRRLRRHRSSPGRRAKRIGPIILLVHGKPGVGKSAVAHELANQLSPHFPDGQLYANLGSGGAARTTGEVHGDFLLALGRKPKAKASRRRKEFLAATARKRLLIVFEAARDAEQLRKLLPNGPGCCVIVTSRRTLAPDFGVPSHHLNIPSTADALEILSAFSKADWRQQPECAADIVNLCGRLPKVLRSVGERISDRSQSLREVADTLSADNSLMLSRFTYAGRNIDEDLTAEYERLTDREKKAFRVLALVDPPTFIPWVLRPLLDVDIAEAENLVAQLAEAELIEVAGPDSSLGPDNPFGIARYRFHPLIREFAKTQLVAKDDITEQDAARDRLDSAYMELTARVLITLDPSLAPVLEGSSEPARWLPDRSPLPMRIAELPSQWVRADYKNWMGASIAAYRAGKWSLCWRIATFLGGPVPDHPVIDDCHRAFALAEEAADRDQVQEAPIEVLLAKGTFLLALESYEEAHAAFNLAAQKIDSLRHDPVQEHLAIKLEAIRHRKIAEGWIQLGAYARASAEVGQALSMLSQTHIQIELDRALLLQADNDARLRLDHGNGRDLTTSLSLQSDDALWFRHQLMKSETVRWQRNWLLAEEYLRNALAQTYGDARRTANVHYRLARLRLNEARSAGSPHHKDDLAWDAVGFAAASVNGFRDMKNVIGVVRARCLLARALAAAGRLAEAEEELRIAQSELSTAAKEDITNPLMARLRLAQGEIWLREKRYSDAIQALCDAIARFGTEGDRWSQVQALLLRGQAERHEKLFVPANITLWAVAAAYMCSGDETGVVNALEQLAVTAYEMRHFATATELRVLAQKGTPRFFSPRVAVMLARSIYTNRGRRQVHAAPSDHEIHFPV